MPKLYDVGEFLKSQQEIQPKSASFWLCAHPIWFLLSHTPPFHVVKVQSGRESAYMRSWAKKLAGFSPVVEGCIEEKKKLTSEIGKC